jgi:NAD(P) transhydrogenase subunit alpha
MSNHDWILSKIVLVVVVLSLVMTGMAGAQQNRTSEPAAPAAATDPTPTSAGPKPDADRASGTLIASITIFVLAIFVGFEVITKVPPTLHTPLMSGSNAISGITVVGALLAAGTQLAGLATWVAALLGTIAVVLATINVVGGFMVTDRMLAMFRKK